MVLIKKLTRIGNSWGIILPAEVMKVAGLEPEGECQLQIEQEGVLLSPHFSSLKKPELDDDLDQRVVEAMAHFIKKYNQDLKKMA